MKKPVSSNVENRTGLPSFITKKYVIAGAGIVLLIVFAFLYFNFWSAPGEKVSRILKQYVERADNALMHDSLETALQLYFQALDIDDRQTTLYGKISESYYFAAERHKQANNVTMYDNMLSQSVYYMNIGLSKDPANPYFLYNAGLLALGRKQNDSALTEMAAAASQGVKAFYLHFYLSDLYNEKEETTLCMEQLLAANELKPDDPRVLFNLGEVYYRIGNYGRALKYHTRLIELDPESIEYKAIYAASLWKNGDEKKAKNLFNQLLQDPNQHQLQRHHVVAWALIDRDVDYAWGIRVAHVTADTKQDITSLEILGWGYYKIGDYRKSVQYLTTAYEKNPGAEVKRRLEMAKEKLQKTGS